MTSDRGSSSSGPRSPPIDKDPVTRTEAEGATIDLPEGLGFFTTGQVLGERYEILEMLGRGGMGEVWRAFDLKLRVEVGLKALREELFQNEGRREMLRQEVRAAREVISPNVCRIFDLIEIDGRELVSMEYVDGATLLGVLQERGPLELKEAQDIASQFLAGLEAIHKASLVHRDVKPENIMLTRAGRVVVMDFGLARGPESGAGSVSGTPAYMAPEHAAGQDVDARADVYSAGVVLAEMVSPEGIKSYESRQSVWEGVRSEPAQVPDSPWAQVIKRAVARDRERRQNSAHTLIRELEDVTLRVEGAEDLHPYPGLASFTEDDAEFFFGREAEVEQMWRRLERPHLLAVVGPSGAGKTSFLRAGLVPSAGSGWRILRCTPGSTPFTALGQSMAREMAGDIEAMELLARGHDPDALVAVVDRWRHKHDHALVVLDQFEELFTQNPPDIQSRFSNLIGRLALEADVFVMLSMRDDFLIRCREHEALAPAFTDLTALLAPTGAALRRALTQPALQCGYRFEDDELVEEMLAEVEGERGALPLLAFAMSRLWEKRDRDSGLLTRQAYQDIGGVGGALARHAEATIDRIGIGRIPIVRELFRNLVTAEGTRAVREWDELLSVFDGEGNAPSPTLQTSGDPSTRETDSLTQDDGDSTVFSPAREAATEILRELIDARLLTSYEVREDEHDPIRRVEIIHESLLANWPRLVRWQTRDADAAQLRDELRQAARTWDEHDRSRDFLWTGTAYREYALWRERYTGGLTEAEDAFAAAMTSLAGRRRRRRRIAVVSVLVISVAVTAATTALWRRSVLQERRAEAQKLIAIGQVRLADYPTAALAHATQSLELSDSEAARFLALEALWKGPTAFVVNQDSANDVRFSSDGSRLVQSPFFAHMGLRVVSQNGVQKVASPGGELFAAFGVGRDHFISIGLGNAKGSIALWSASDVQQLASAKPVDDPDGTPWGAAGMPAAAGRPRAVFALKKGDHVTVHALHADGNHELLGSLRMAIRDGRGGSVCSPRASGEWIGIVDGNEVSVAKVSDDGLSDPLVLGRHEGDLLPFCDADPLGRYFVTINQSGKIKLWDASGRHGSQSIDGPRNLIHTEFSRDGSNFFATSSTDRVVSDVWIWSVDDLMLRLRRRIDRVKYGLRASVDPVGPWLALSGPLPASRLWSLAGPAGEEPIVLRHGPVNQIISSPEFSPDGRWLATADTSGLILWPLTRRFPAVIRHGFDRWTGGVEFGPEGRFLLIAAGGTISYFPLEGPVPPASRTLLKVKTTIGDVAVSPDGELFASSGRAGVWVGRIDGGEPRSLAIPSMFITFSPDGQKLALGGGRILSLEDILDETSPDGFSADMQDVPVQALAGNDFGFFFTFARDGRLLAGTRKGVEAWELETGDHEILAEVDAGLFAASADGRRLLVLDGGGEGGLTQDPLGSPVFVDLDTGEATTLTTHGTRVWSIAMDRGGTVAVTGDRNGIVRVGPVTGEEPHLLLGHDESDIMHVTVDPSGRWIASSSQDGTVRLWPMPDLTKPPLHTLPREELIAKLKTLTNLRVVRDPESATGWTLTHDPFPGWETVPTW